MDHPICIYRNMQPTQRRPRRPRRQHQHRSSKAWTRRFQFLLPFPPSPPSPPLSASPLLLTRNLFSRILLLFSLLSVVQQQYLSVVQANDEAIADVNTFQDYHLDCMVCYAATTEALCSHCKNDPLCWKCLVTWVQTQAEAKQSISCPNCRSLKSFPLQALGERFLAYKKQKQTNKATAIATAAEAAQVDEQQLDSQDRQAMQRMRWVMLTQPENISPPEIDVHQFLLGYLHTLKAFVQEDPIASATQLFHRELFQRLKEFRRFASPPPTTATTTSTSTSTSTNPTPFILEARNILHHIDVVVFQHVTLPQALQALHPTFHLVAWTGHTFSVQGLLTRFADSLDVNAPNENGETALMLALHGPRLCVIALLLRVSNIDVNAADKRGETVLMKASKLGFAHVVSKLLRASNDMKLDVNAQDQDGWTALLLASYVGHASVVKLLTQRGKALVNQLNEKLGFTALMLAAWTNQIDVIRVLLQVKGIQIHVQNSVGQTATDLALEKGHDQVVHLLREGETRRFQHLRTQRNPGF